MKALVVDDDLITRIVLQETLSSYADVHSCGDGNEAVLLCRRALERGDPYDLICMDVLMPVMGGLEALKLIRREEELHGRVRPEATKVVITTAADDKDTINQAFRQLCDAYVVKPIDTGEIIDIVRCLFPLEDRSG
jgi:two-component system, chemotaxis family, chemotaxis protein CheY